MRSEIEPPAVAVKGIDAKAVEAMGWKPTRLMFKMLGRASRKSFPVSFAIRQNQIQ
jgi:hypothetical protein